MARSKAPAANAKRRAARPRTQEDAKYRESQFVNGTWSTPFTFYRPRTKETNDLMAVIGKLVDDANELDDSPHAALQLTNLVLGKLKDLPYRAGSPLFASTDQERVDARVDPTPADISAMLRLTEYFLRTEGDVFQSIRIPGQVILKPVEVTCEDIGAQRAWQDIFYKMVEGNGARFIDYLNEQIYYCTEQYANTFPLEAWDGNELVGVSFLEPVSVWVGHHLSFNGQPLALNMPEAFPMEKFKDMLHRTMYNSFVTDLNVQYTAAYRVPIKPEFMTPIYAQKLAFQRYAIPHIARASRSIMFRQILDELRRGTIESYINQIIVAYVGNEKEMPAPSKKMMDMVTANLDTASKNRTGTLTFPWFVKLDILAPKPLDTMLSDAIWAQTTQAIFRELGFSMFFASGEVPGEHGRGGGVQVEIDVQIAIERWKYLLTRADRWLYHLASKIATKNGSLALIKSLGSLKFVREPIGVEQREIIKAQIVPLYQAGLYSEHTALDKAGDSYDRELQFKQKEAPNEGLFGPKMTFKQGVQKDGATQGFESAPQGRPASGLSASRVFGQVDDWRSEIAAHYDEAMQAKDRKKALLLFLAWLAQELESEMMKAYQEGFASGGGLGEIDYGFLNAAAQGPHFHANHLDEFGKDLQANAGDARELTKLRNRATMYASASGTAYMLGVQAAMRSHGANAWQRVLHPELSLSGPCADCSADSAVVHKIEEPFFEFHPAGVCSMQEMRFSFGEQLPTFGVPIPNYGLPTQHVTRRLPRG